jgi:hypothetical protein
MLINQAKVKQLVRENKKQASGEFMEQLDYRVRSLVLRAIKNSNHFKRLTASELI